MTLSEQFPNPIETSCKKENLIQVPPKHIYTTVHFSVLVQTLKKRGGDRLCLCDQAFLHKINCSLESQFY